jgi:hypothetical protein
MQIPLLVQFMLPPVHQLIISSAYELYADPKTDMPSTATAVGSQERDTITMAQRFKSTFSHNNVKVISWARGT